MDKTTRFIVNPNIFPDNSLLNHYTDTIKEANRTDAEFNKSPMEVLENIESNTKYTQQIAESSNKIAESSMEISKTAKEIALSSRETSISAKETADIAFRQSKDVFSKVIAGVSLIITLSVEYDAIAERIAILLARLNII